MQLDLQCPNCARHFTPADSPAGKTLEWMAEEVPWTALGDGETFEDSLYTALNESGTNRCPSCGTAGEVDERSLSQAAMEMLAHW